MNSIKATLQRRIDAAMGRVPCDVLLKNAYFLDVFSCEWKSGDLAVYDGVVVSVDPGLKAARTIDLKKKHIVPGFIDAHVHVESSMMIPGNFEASVLPKGTTTAVCDPHEIANVLGTRGIEYFLKQSETLQMDLRVMLSSCVPATHLETNGGGILNSSDLKPFASHPQTLGLAEVMNVPAVLNADPTMMNKLSDFMAMPIDGHCPLLSGPALSAYAAAGISSCHESSLLPEAQEKLSKGISVWIREGSVAKDLHTLLPMLTLATSTSVGFCTDDRNPLDIAREGHLDYLIRESIAKGIPAEVAYRAASWSVARHYGLDRGIRRTGAIAPGYRADLVVLDDAKTCAIQNVWCAGKEVGADFGTGTKNQTKFDNTIRAKIPEARDLEGPTGRVHVIQVSPGKIITGRQVLSHSASGVLRLSVLERYGHSSRPANAYATGFGESFRGAIASSVGHDSHNLIVVGSSTADMREALAVLIRVGGGFAVVQNGSVLAELALPYAGLMSAVAPAELTHKLEALQAASRSIGCSLPDPFLQLAFLSLPVIPSLKLTDKGLVDVDQFKIISVSA